MSILGKMMFWKHDELGLGKDLSLPPQSVPGIPPSMPQDDLGLGMPKMMPISEPPRMESFSEPRQYSQPQYTGGKDMEIISAKLDALRATLESVNQRLSNIERIAYGEEDTRRKGW